MVRRIIIFLIFLQSVGVFAQERNPFYIGHSLVNHNMPYMVQALAKDAGKQSKYAVQIINGSPLLNNFNNAATAEGTSFRSVFPGGNFNTMVITEAVPLQNHLTWSETYGTADKFYKYAKDNNNGTAIKFYIYETWHCINSGIPSSNSNFPNGCSYDDTAHSKTLWHERLLLDFPLWSGIVNHVRLQNPNDNQIWMVPAGQAFYNLTTQINAGNVPNLSSFRDLYSDDIHMTNAGNYFVACVMYATIYGQSPEGLTSNVNDQWGTPYTNMPSQAQALALQKIAWSTVTSLSTWTGVSNSTSSADGESQSFSFSIFPNPSSDFISISSDDLLSNNIAQFYNATGNLVKESTIDNVGVVDISNLPIGLYFVRLKDMPFQIRKFLKH